MGRIERSGGGFTPMGQQAWEDRVIGLRTYYNECAHFSVDPAANYE